MLRVFTIILTIAITAAVIYYGIATLSPETPMMARLQAPPAPAAVSHEASNEPANQTANGQTGSADNGLSEDEARHIAAEVGAAAAAKVAQSMTHQDVDANQTGTTNAGTTGSGLTADQIRSIAHSEAEAVVNEELDRLRAAMTAARAAKPAAAPKHVERPKPKPRPRPEPAPAHHSAARPEPARPTHTASLKPHPAAKTTTAHASSTQHATQPSATHDKSAASPPPAPTAVWWTKPSDVKKGQFALVYAGPAAFGHSIVLLFNENVKSPSQAAPHLHIFDQHGKPVSGHWSSGDNHWTLKHAVSPGHYVVEVGAGVLAVSGKSLDKPLRGEVVIP